jgi:hypothetical protein
MREEVSTAGPLRLRVGNVYKRVIFADARSGPAGDGLKGPSDFD